MNVFSPRIPAIYESVYFSSDEEIYAHYLWNIQLEALYPSLQALEVALRNSLCNAIVDKFDGCFHEVTYTFLEQKKLIKFDGVEKKTNR